MKCQFGDFFNLSQRVRTVSYVDSNSPKYSTFKSNFLWSSVSVTPLITGGRCQWLRWPVMGGINETADLWWSVLMTPLTSDQRCHWYCPPGLQIQAILAGSGSTLQKSGSGSDVKLKLSHSGTGDKWRAVSMPPLTSAGQWQWHCGFNVANFV
jgi:hypothetical protein